MHLGHTYGATRERHPFLLKPLRPAIFGHPRFAPTDVSQRSRVAKKGATLPAIFFSVCVANDGTFYESKLLNFTLHFSRLAELKTIFLFGVFLLRAAHDDEQ